MKHATRFIKLVLLWPAFMSLPAYAQQDPQFSMYMFDKMAVNPAAAGSKDALEANLIGRDQWVDIEGAPRTAGLMVQAPFSSQKIGWGVELESDHIGPTTSTSLQANYAYHLRCASGQLSMGLGIGLYDYVINFSQINYKDQNDPYANANRSQVIVPTGEAGLYYYSHSFYAGLSFNHLIQSRLISSQIDKNDDSIAAFRPHAYFIIGQGYRLSDNLVFNPSLLLKFAQNSPVTGDITANFLLQNKIWLGASYRIGYGFVIMAAYKVSKMLQVGYSYDFGINSIGNVGGGSHEICLTLDLGNRKTMQRSPRYF